MPGRRGAVAGDARTREVRLRHSSDEACEQSWATGGGAGGAKGGGRGKHGRATHAPDTEPGKCAPGAGPCTASSKGKEEERFTALLHHVDVALLRDAYFWLKRNAAPGVDGVTWQEYAQDLEAKLVDLHARIHRGAYRALPSRRKYIAKPDGRQRPLGIAALEDKIAQRALVEVLNAIYVAPGKIWERRKQKYAETFQW